jgi:hypothetical protein
MDNLKIVKLQSYLDKCFISAILCDYHYQYYNKINMIVMLPTIIGSAMLTCLNSSDIENNLIKWINITVNGTNTLIIAITTNYKLQDRLTTYKALYNKYQKLSHKIESTINNSFEITDTIIDDIINEYDILQNDNDYGFLSSYKKKIVTKYGKTKQLPNSLQLDSDLVITNSLQLNSNLVISNV